MYLYLILHGSYGLFWLWKDFIFPDVRGKPKASIGSHLILFVLLFGYWCIPVPLAVRAGLVDPSTNRMISIIVMYVVGLILMMGSDYQKYRTLKKKKGKKC